MIAIKNLSARSMSHNDMLFWLHDGKEYALHVERDDASINPRKDMDNVGRMFCSHGRYALGDYADTKMSAWEFLRDLMEDAVPDGDIAAYVKLRPIKDTDLAALSPEEIPDAFLDAVTEEEIPLSYCLGLLRGHAVILPLWLYDHSGISMSCGERTYPYDDRWDSGQVGWIAVTRKDAMENLGVQKPDGSWAMAGESDWEKAAIDCIRAEVETYDQYLTGDIYWYELKSRPEAESGGLDTDSDGWMDEDSCGGFFGADIMKSGLADNVGCGLAEAIEAGTVSAGSAYPVTVTTIRYAKNR